MSQTAHLQAPGEAADGRGFYRAVLRELNAREIPFLVGGAQMLESYSSVRRELKDLDIYIRRKDLDLTLRALSAAGCRTEMCFSHWLAKAYDGPLFVDIIFSSGNGVCEVGDDWFEHSREGEVFGTPIRFCPPEEMIWSKAFVMERERYDGADVAHLFLSCGDRMDWHRLLRNFEPHWRVLLSYLILFGFIYPSERVLIPEWIMRELLTRVQNEMAAGAAKTGLCQGTLLSRTQFAIDVDAWGYQDARLFPFGAMKPEEAAQWTQAGAHSINSSVRNATFNLCEKGDKHEAK